MAAEYPSGILQIVMYATVIAGFVTTCRATGIISLIYL